MRDTSGYFDTLTDNVSLSKPSNFHKHFCDLHTEI